MAYIEDRWMDKAGNRKSRHGQGARFRVMDRQGGKLVVLGSFDRKPDAERRQAEVRIAGQTGTSPDAVPDKDITFGWVLSRFEANPIKVSQPSESIKPGTITQYVTNGRTLIDLIGANVPLAEFTRLSVSKLPRLVADLKSRGLGPGSVNQHLKLLGTMYALGSYYGQRPVPLQAPSTSRFRMTTPKREDLAFSSGDLQALLDAAPPRFAAFLRLAAYSGMRVSEIRGLTREDVSLTGRIIRIRRQAGTTSMALVTLKTTEKAKRDIHLASHVVDALSAHLEATATIRAKRPDLNLIFPTLNGTIFSAANLTNREWTDTKRKAALDGLLEATGDAHDAAAMEHVAHEARRTARAEAGDAGRMVGAIIDAGDKAYHRAEVTYLSDLLPDEHPAAIRAALFAAVDFHHLRRSFATRMLVETQGDIVAVAAALGDNVQTAFNNYILQTAKDVDLLRAVSENLYSEQEGSVYVALTDDVADALVRVYEENIAGLEAQAVALHAEADEKKRLLLLWDRIEAAQADLDALETVTEALRGHRPAEVFAALPEHVKRNPAVVQLLKDHADTEALERAQYERLRAKFGD